MRKTFAAVMTAAFLFIAPGPAFAHVPNTGLAAGHFSVPARHMCPDPEVKRNGDLCSWYGRAYCHRTALSKRYHAVVCQRDSVDRVILGGKKYRMTWRASGTVDHNYLTHRFTLQILGWARGW